MQGIVKGVSASHHRIAVLTDEGYAILDLDDGEARMNDTITGVLDDHGDQEVTNTTTGHRLSVTIVAIQATRTAAQSLLSRR